MAGLDGTIKLPAVGEVKKKTALIVGGSAIVIGGVVYIRNRKAASASDSGTSTDTSASNQSGTDSGIDPATGIPYADEGGSEGIDPATGIPYAEESSLGDFGDIGGEIDPNTGIPFADEFGGGSGNIGTGGAVGGGITTKEEWVQQAESDLNAPALGGAAAKIFGGLSVTKNEKDLFLEAVGLEGPPPGGYPTPIKLQDTAGQPKPPLNPKPGPKSPGNPHGNKTRTIHASGMFDVNGIARNHGISEARLLELNPGLRHFEGSGHKVPKGTPVKIPVK